MPGPRHHITLRKLWNKFPDSYKHGLCYTDFYPIYSKIIPKKQHHAGGIDEGETNHLERFNCTFSNCTCRQSEPCLSRKTLSFSKRHL